MNDDAVPHSRFFYTATSYEDGDYVAFTSDSEEDGVHETYYGTIIPTKVFPAVEAIAGSSSTVIYTIQIDQTRKRLDIGYGRHVHVYQREILGRVEDI